MMIRVTAIALTGLIACACSSVGGGGRVSSINMPVGLISSTQGMVLQQQARQDADIRCSWKESEVQAGMSGGAKTKKTNPSCGNYRP